jgi:uncharacterized protein (TIGR03032 family)
VRGRIGEAEMQKFSGSRVNKSKARELYLLSLCNQTASPQHSLAVVDLRTGDMAWIELENLPSDVLAGIEGICGACRVSDGEIVACTQSVARPSLLLVDIYSKWVKSYRTLEGVRDAHSLAHDGSCIYVVSTGTNEIYRIGFEGGEFQGEELHWRFPGVGREEDEVHLNGIAMDGQRLVASCFGKRSEDEGWGKRGQIFYTDSNEVILSGLGQPHTPLISEGMLAIAESGAGRVHVLRREKGGRWEPWQVFDVGEYTRGLDIRGGLLYVGVSSTRKVSRSKKVVVAGRKDHLATRVAVLDMRTGKEEAQYELALLGRELYDMLPIHTEVRLRPVMDAVSARIREIEGTVDRYVTWVQESSCKRAALQDALNRTQAELNRTLDHRIRRLLAKMRRGK